MRLKTLGLESFAFGLMLDALSESLTWHVAYLYT